MQDIDNIIQGVSAEALRYLIHFLEEEKVASYIVDEIVKTGNLSNPTDILQVANLLIEELRYKSAENVLEANETFSLFEWLHYWFGEAAQKSDLSNSGVFEKQGNMFLENMKTYADSFNKINMEIPEAARAEAITDKLMFDQAVTDGNTQEIQNFINKYAPTYKTKDGKPVAPKGELEKDIASYSAKNKKLFEDMNAKITQDNKNLLEDALKFFEKRISELRGEIDEQVPYRKDVLKEAGKFRKDPDEDIDPYSYFETPAVNAEGVEGVKVHKVEKGESENDNPNILLHSSTVAQNIKTMESLIEAREDNVDFYASLLTDKARTFSQASQELPQLKEELKKVMAESQPAEKEALQIKEIENQIAEINSTASTDTNVYNSIENRTKAIEKLRADGVEITPEQQQALETDHAQLNALVQKRQEDNKKLSQLKFKLYHLEAFPEEKELKKESLENSIEILEKEVHDYNKNEQASNAYTRAAKIYKQKLKSITNELTQYETATIILQQAKHVAPKDLKNIINMANKILKEREQIVLLEQTSPDFTLVEEANTPKEELANENDIKKLQDKFTEFFDKTKFSETNKTLANVQKNLSKLIQNQLDAIKAAYIKCTQEITNEIDKYNKGTSGEDSTKKTTIQKVLFDKQAMQAEIKNLKSVYENKKATADFFRKNKSIGTLPETNTDTKFQEDLTYIRTALNKLSVFIEGVVNSKFKEDAAKELKGAGITIEMLQEALAELKNLGASSKENPYGINQLTAVVEGLKTLEGNATTALPVRGKDFISQLSNGAKSVKKLSEVQVQKTVDALDLFINAVDNVLSPTVVDPDKLLNLLKDATKTEGINDLTLTKPFMDFMETAQKFATMQHNIGQKFARTSIEKPLATFLEILKKINKQDLDASKTPGQEDAPAQENADDKKYDALLSILKEAEGSTEAERLINRTLRPQISYLIKVIGDGRYGKHADTADERSNDTLTKNKMLYYQGLSASKESPHKILDQNKDWYDHLRVWASLVEQCKRSIKGARTAKDLSYTSKPTERSPQRKTVGEGPVGAELQELKSTFKKTQDPAIKTQIERLDNYLYKVRQKPEGLIQIEIRNLEKQKPVNTKLIDFYKGIASKIALHKKKSGQDPQELLQELLDAGILSPREKDAVDSLSNSPEDRALVKSLEKKWGNASTAEGSVARKEQIALETKIGKIYEDINKLKIKLANYAFPDDDYVKYLKTPDSKITNKHKLTMRAYTKAFKKTPEYQEYLQTPEYAKFAEISKNMNELSTIAKELQVPLFKSKYAPNLITPEDKEQLDTALKTFEKEEGKDKLKVYDPSAQKKIPSVGTKEDNRKNKVIEKYLPELVNKFLELLVNIHHLDEVSIDPKTRLPIPQQDVTKEQTDEIQWIDELTDTAGSIKKSKKLKEEIVNIQNKIKNPEMGLKGKEDIPQLKETLKKYQAELEKIGDNPTAIQNNMYREIYDYPEDMLKNQALQDVYTQLKKFLGIYLNIDDSYTSETLEETFELFKKFVLDFLHKEIN